MESINSYGSDEEIGESSSGNAGFNSGEREMVRQGDEDTNYDNVQMDMSEESNNNSPDRSSSRSEDSSNSDKMSEDSRSHKSSSSTDRDSADEVKPPVAKFGSGENKAAATKLPPSPKYSEKDHRSKEKKEHSGRDSRRERDVNKDQGHRDVNKDQRHKDVNKDRHSHEKGHRSRSRDRSRRSHGKEVRKSPPRKERERHSRGKVSPDRKRRRPSRSRSPPSHPYTSSSRHSDSGSSRSSRDSHRRSRSRDRAQAASKRSSSKERDRSSRNRSRSKDRQRSKSRERRRGGGYEKKPNKLTILERLGIELRPPDSCPNVTPQQILQRSMDQQAMQMGGGSGMELPKYYNPGAVNPLRYAEQMQKRRLLWGHKAQPQQPQQQASSGGSGDAKPQMSNNKWEGTTFAQDQDGKMTAKFKRLMGIKDSGQGASGSCSASTEGNEMLKKQEELFNTMEMQYEVARVATHTHRGVGLGFGTFQYR